MSLLDDIKAKVDNFTKSVGDHLDADKDGKFKLEDVKKMAQDSGFGDKFDAVSKAVVGEDGKLSGDDVTRIMEDIKKGAGDVAGKVGDTVADAKDKLFGKK